MSVYAKRGVAVRVAYLFAAYLYWAASGFGRFYGRRAVVLCYHSVRDSQRERFRRQVRRVRGRIIGLDELPSLRRRSRFGPPRVAITFDDAFACLLRNAAPALRQERGKATIFAVSGCLGRTPTWRMPSGHPDCAERTMSADELRDALRSGVIRVGSHTRSHTPMDTLSDCEAREELRVSKRELEAALGVAVVDVALPHGAGGGRAVRIAGEEGYSRALTLDPRCVKAGDDSSAIGRFSASPDMWAVEHRLTVDGAYQWLPHVRGAAWWITSRLRAVGRRVGASSGASLTREHV